MFVLCPPSLQSPSLTAVGGSGGEGIPTGRDALPEREAELQRLSGRLHDCHHWQEAAAAAESDGAASGGKLQVQVVHKYLGKQHRASNESFKSLTLTTKMYL